MCDVIFCARCRNLSYDNIGLCPYHIQEDLDKWEQHRLNTDPRSDKEFASDAQKTLDDLTFFSPCDQLDSISLDDVKYYVDMGYKLKGSQNTGVELDSCAWNEGDFTKADIIQVYPVDGIIWFVYL